MMNGKMERNQIESLAEEVYNNSLKHLRKGDKFRLVRGMAMAYGLYSLLKEEEMSNLCRKFVESYSEDSTYWLSYGRDKTHFITNIHDYLLEERIKTRFDIHSLPLN